MNPNCDEDRKRKRLIQRSIEDSFKRQKNERSENHPLQEYQGTIAYEFPPLFNILGNLSVTLFVIILSYVPAEINIDSEISKDTAKNSVPYN